MPYTAPSKGFLVSASCLKSSILVISSQSTVKLTGLAFSDSRLQCPDCCFLWIIPVFSRFPLQNHAAPRRNIFRYEALGQSDKRYPRHRSSAHHSLRKFPLSCYKWWCLLVPGLKCSFGDPRTMWYPVFSVHFHFGLLLQKSWKGRFPPSAALP